MVTELNIEHLGLLTALERQALSGASDSQMLEALGNDDACVLGWWQKGGIAGLRHCDKVTV
ncbi:hypothetical protein HSBAA_06760 [Vreelandella sulfidaeris]|uniref:Uncharacterized protein n=1 Tax=Vreelandella sulfidaeris TaxID=115553 RepID=A0A455U0D2_9GAMM|nr:hypothetical protein HSBAA_06760 [Halomonas sulfidaeris]